MKKYIDNISYTGFIEKYTKNLPQGFHWQNSPLQIYSLEDISKQLILPTPLLKADYHFVVILNKGDFYHQIGIEKIHIHAHSIMFIPEGETFSIISVDDDISGYFILMDNKSVTSTIETKDLVSFLEIESILNIDIDSYDWFNNICLLLLEEVKQKIPNRNIGSGLLKALIYKIIELSGINKYKSRQSEIASKFKILLNKNFINHKNVDYYASEIGVSSNYLNRCVKNHYNKNCKQIIQEFTILQGQLLMFNGSNDIGEICYNIGYNDPSYFSRLFKKVTGMTPRKYRQIIAQDLS